MRSQNGSCTDNVPSLSAPFSYNLITGTQYTSPYTSRQERQRQQKYIFSRSAVHRRTHVNNRHTNTNTKSLTMTAVPPEGNKFSKEEKMFIEKLFQAFDTDRSGMALLFFLFLKILGSFSASYESFYSVEYESI